MNSTNNTRDSSNNLLCDEKRIYFFLMVAIHIVTFLCNFITAIAIWRLPGLKKNRYHLIVRTLCLSDCLIPLSSLPISVISFIQCSWVGGEISCTLTAFLSTAFLSWSALIVTVMCLLRFLAVKKPLFYRKNVTYARINKALALAFVWGCSHLVLPLTGLGKFRLHDRGFYCALDITSENPKDLTLVYITISEGLIIILAMVYFSIVVALVVKKKRKVSNSLSIQQKRGVGIGIIKKREECFASMTVVIVLLYCICYVPFLIYRAIMVLRGPSEINDYSYYFTELVAHLNPLLNPLVYVACSRQYRNSIKRLLTICGIRQLNLLVQKCISSDSYTMSMIEMRKLSALSSKSEATLID